MGRVARYKMVKACDPYSKKNGGRLAPNVWGLGDDGRRPKKRSHKSEQLRARKNKARAGIREEFDAPPEKDDFDLKDMFGSLKKEKPLVLEPEKRLPTETSKKVSLPTPSAKAPAAASPIDSDEKLANHLLKLDKQVQPQEPAFEGRRDGESKRAFQRRVRSETRQIIKRERMDQHNPEKRKRKKEFLNNKKNKKKKAAHLIRDNEVDQSDEEVSGGLITGEQAVAARARATQVQFGEQAERPPVFREVPRGATKKAPSASSLPQKLTMKTMNEQDIQAEQSAMEQIRRKVQAQYAVIKSKRKQAGDFHL